MACSLFYFPAFISLCLFYFLSLWTKVCTSPLDVWWLFGSTDILSNSNHSRGNSKTITLGQPPILYVLHAGWECLVLHMHWGKTIKTGIFAWWCVKTWSRMFFLMTVCCCGVIYTLYLAVLFCVCLPVCFFLCFVSQNIIRTECPPTTLILVLNPTKLTKMKSWVAEAWWWPTVWVWIMIYRYSLMPRIKTHSLGSVLSLKR